MISQWDSYMIPGSELVAFEPDASDAVLMLDDGASSDVVLLLEDGAYILSAYKVRLLPGDFAESVMR